MKTTPKTKKKAARPSAFTRDIKAAQKESRAGLGVPYRWGVLR